MKKHWIICMALLATLALASCAKTPDTPAETGGQSVEETVAETEMCQHVYAADGYCELCGREKPTEGLEYTLNDDGESYSVSGIGTATGTEKIVIADTYDGLPVTNIGDRAFLFCSNLTSITIPDSVTNIGDTAFAGCINLTSITIPDSVMIIGSYAFTDCTGLTSISIPDSVTSKSIGDSAFVGCTNLIQEEGGVYYVDTWAIDCDTSVTSVTLRAGTKVIDNSAFSGCTGLMSITIPDSVTSIGDAFSGCSALTSITVASGNPVYHATENCLIETAGKVLVGGCKNSVIPTDGSVTSIGSWAFSGCDSLTSITIPDSVTSIGSYAFLACTGLTSITIPDSVTSIGDAAFLYCSSLTSITFQGTTSEWQAIEKGEGLYTIHCTDGTISEDGTVTPNA